MRDTRPCMEWVVFYGHTQWDMQSIDRYIEAANKIYAHFGISPTHDGFAESPHGTIKGPHIGSIKHVEKKMRSIIEKQARCTALSFFDLPVNYHSQHTEYSVHINRTANSIYVGYDRSAYPSVPIDGAADMLKQHIEPIWGTHFATDTKVPPIQFIANEICTYKHGAVPSYGPDTEIPVLFYKVKIIEQYIQESR